MHRHRCYVTLLSLSVLYFLLTTHTHTHAHSLHTPYADEKKEREKKKVKKKKQNCLPTNNHTNRRTYVYTHCQLKDRRCLVIISLFLVLSHDLCNQSMNFEILFTFLTFFSFI